MAPRNWLILSLTTGIGPILGRRLIDAAGSAEAATQLTRRELAQIEGIGLGKAQAVADALKVAEADAILQMSRASELGAKIVSPDDDSWPALLKQIPAAPLVLFVMGILEPRDLNSLAIVGSRRCSHYGREQAERFAALLAGAGFTVISGGARGVDSAAHRGAIIHPHGRTIAVLGSGLDVPYPPENKPLFDQIVQRGALISEFPFATPPNAENFPRRNRIVSGLSRGVLVIEADERSGALITARLANEEHGRPVFALPGRVDNQMAAGPHLLIRDGATLVSKLEDIVSALDPLPDHVHQPELFANEIAPEQSPTGPPANLSDRQRLILSQLGPDPAAVDDIIDKTNLPAPAVLQELTFLTLRGLLKRADGQTYIKI